jgi:hypothetical protein
MRAEDLTYLGDSVYVRININGQLELITSNGIDITNVIYIEPEVFRSLEIFVESLRKKKIKNYDRCGVDSDTLIEARYVYVLLALVQNHPKYVQQVQFLPSVTKFIKGEVWVF